MPSIHNFYIRNHIIFFPNDIYHVTQSYHALACCYFISYPTITVYQTDTHHRLQFSFAQNAIGVSYL